MGIDLCKLFHEPFDLERGGYGGWTTGDYKSLDGTEAGKFSKDDVDEMLYHGIEGDRWDGAEAAVFRLKDGRLVAFEASYGPTGDGFCEDAYGGDADIYFAKDLKILVNSALTDAGRVMCGIPREGL